MNNEAVVIFDRMDALLSAPGVWVKGARARDKHGRRVDPNAPTAKCFCLQGAFDYIIPSYSYCDVRKAREVLIDVVTEKLRDERAYSCSPDWSNVGVWNDYSETVLDDVKAVIAEAKKRVEG